MRDVPLGVDMTIEQMTAIWLAQYSSANTRSAYSSDLRAFLAWIGDGVAAMGATTDDLAQYRAEREHGGVSPETVDRQFAAPRAFYTAARQLGHCADNPFGTRPPAVGTTSGTDTLTPAEVARLHEAAALDPRTAVLVRLLLGHLIEQAATTAGIERPVSANVLRRTHVTTAQRAGVPIDDIRHTMGHTDVRTTRRYLQPSETEQAIQAEGS